MCASGQGGETRGCLFELRKHRFREVVFLGGTQQTRSSSLLALTLPLCHQDMEVC